MQDYKSRIWLKFSISFSKEGFSKEAPKADNVKGKNYRCEFDDKNDDTPF